LYLYSIEPPFYAELKKASVLMNRKFLKTLGPFARAIFQILYNGPVSDKKRDDALKIGMVLQKKK